MRRLVVVLLLATNLEGFAQPKPSAEQLEFFEKQIRPLFVEHCIRCHGEKKQEAGLRLDTAAGLAKGADTGPIVVPGDPSKSRLIASVKREGEYAMPPSKPLPAKEVEALVAWVTMGASFPAPVAKVEANASAKHWAFQPIRDPAVPNRAASSPIDAFVHEKLHTNGLKPSPSADKRTLIRRAYYDLIGLPPSAADIDAFEHDPSPNAYEQLLDKLLAMPQYGERWGRHWLDVARYADSKGYVFTEDRAYPYAYTYREYLINALNADMPYNQFVLEQLAADKLGNSDKKSLAAMGFLTVGRRFSNNIHDIIDDRIDLVSRGLLGLTIGCARCHDHKYDAIPIADYYSLYGVFASSFEPKDLPIISEVARTPEVIAFEAELARKEKAADDYAKKMYADALAPFKKPDVIAEYLLAANESRAVASDKVDKWAVDRKLDPRMLDRWRTALRHAENDPIFRPWAKLSAAKPNDFIAKRSEVLKEPMNTFVHTAIVECAPKSPKELASVYGELLSIASRDTSESKSKDWSAIVTKLMAPEAVLNPNVNDADKLVKVEIKRVFRNLRNDAAKFRANSPFSPPRAMVMNDNPRPTEPVVFLRGSPNNRGPQVPRQVPKLIDANRKPFTDGSGRLELAKAIVSPTNPLTARVIVNRVWIWHFGEGLVRTPSDFGVRTEPPSHPELLDWLATRFVTDDGWSLKKLHKRIMLSATYRQSSRETPELAKRDPENRLLARFDRQRLDFEGFRDSILAAAGQLDLSKVGGKSVDLFTAPFAKRRAVYGLVDRQNLPSGFRAFDFASPEQHTPQRFTTTVPQQALFLLNSPFVLEASKGIVSRTQAGTTTERVIAMYRAVLSRNPNAEELKLATEFVNSGTQTWEQFAQVLLLSNEFAFID